MRGHLVNVHLIPTIELERNQIYAPPHTLGLTVLLLNLDFIQSLAEMIFKSKTSQGQLIALLGNGLSTEMA